MAARFRGWLSWPVVLAAMVAPVLALAGCDDRAGADVAKVRIAGKTFFLEVAATDEVRYKGLGGRTHIEDDGGMLFVFPREGLLGFVMRDCPIPIDIMFLDGSGRILTMHEMSAEAPRAAGESDDAYNERLKKYPSRFPSQLVIELRGGMMRKLGIKEGDKVELDAPALKAKAR